MYRNNSRSRKKFATFGDFWRFLKPNSKKGAKRCLENFLVQLTEKTPCPYLFYFSQKFASKGSIHAYSEVFMQISCSAFAQRLHSVTWHSEPARGVKALHESWVHVPQRQIPVEAVSTVIVHSFCTLYYYCGFLICCSVRWVDQNKPGYHSN